MKRVIVSLPDSRTSAFETKLDDQVSASLV